MDPGRVYLHQFASLLQVVIRRRANTKLMSFMDGLQSKLKVAPVTRKAWKGLSLIKATKKYPNQSACWYPKTPRSLVFWSQMSTCLLTESYAHWNYWLRHQINNPISEDLTQHSSFKQSSTIKPCTNWYYTFKFWCKILEQRKYGRVDLSKDTPLASFALERTSTYRHFLDDTTYK